MPCFELSCGLSCVLSCDCLLIVLRLSCEAGAGPYRACRGRGWGFTCGPPDAPKLLPRSCLARPGHCGVCSQAPGHGAAQLGMPFCQDCAGQCRFACLTVQRLCLSGLPSNQARKEMGIMSAQSQTTGHKWPRRAKSKGTEEGATTPRMGMASLPGAPPWPTKRLPWTGCAL